ncbi:hypothetical protein JXQ70_03740 [bacterium]|nr:hypothetical protein [bacterium]
MRTNCRSFCWPKLLRTAIIASCLILLVLFFRHHRALPVTVEVTPEALDWLNEFVLSGLHETSSQPAQSVTMCPEALITHPLVILTLYKPDRPIQRYLFRKGFIEQDQSRKIRTILHEAGPDTSLRIDVQASPLHRIWFKNKYYWFWVYEPGKTGVFWDNGGQEGYLSPGQPIEQGIGPNKTWSHYSPHWTDIRPILYRFITHSYVYLPGASALVALERGEPPPPELNQANIRAAIIEAADYLVRQTAPSGKFVYEYDPIDQSNSSHYNALRHAGTTFALFQVYGLTSDSKYLEAGDRALNYLDRLTTIKDGFRFIIENNYAKLGGAALAVLAMVERETHVRDGRDLPKIHAFARFIERSQRDDGDFIRFDPYNPTRKAELEKSIYYPGEATFALTRLAGLTGEQHWLDAALKGARALSRRWSFLGIDWFVPFDAWLLYALSELFEQTRQPWLYDYASTIARRMVLYQFGPGANRNPDFCGGAFDPVFPQSTPTGARAEGLGAFCTMLSHTGHLSDFYRTALMNSGRFQLRQAFRPDNSYYLPCPEKARGGFRKSIVEPQLRIDYTQHNISSLLYLLEWTNYEQEPDDLTITH